MTHELKAYSVIMFERNTPVGMRTVDYALWALLVLWEANELDRHLKAL